jgi:hypothetical protein
MCFAGPKMPEASDPPAPPPPPPPPPAPTAQGLTVGDKRKTSPIKNFMKKSVGANRSNPSLTIPLAGYDSAAGAGVNIPR